MIKDIDKISTSEGSSFLKAWEIHKVTLLSVEKEHSKSKDSGKPLHSLNFTFGNDNASFTVKLFCPVGKEECIEGCKRQRIGNNEFDSASQEEVFVLNIRHIVAASNQTNAKGLTPIQRFDNFYNRKDPIVSIQNFDEFCAGVEKICKEIYIDTNLMLNLKLIGNQEGYSRVPNIVGISKKNTLYINNSYICLEGENKLSFSAAELKRKEDFAARARSRADQDSDTMADEDDSDIQPVDNNHNLDNFQVDEI